MKTKYNLAYVITFLLFVLSISITMTNYNVSINTSKEQIIRQVLPLSLDNVYNEIQHKIIEPYIITQTMGSNIFIKHWLMDENKEKDQDIIFEYLTKFKQEFAQYNIYSTFLVDTSTQKYYKPHGETLTLRKEHDHDKWYFDLIESGEEELIRLNLNLNLSNELTLYYDSVILDESGRRIGITGIGLRFPYIDRLFKRFRQEHGITISFYDHNATLTLSELDNDAIPHKLSQQLHVEQMISENLSDIEFHRDGQDYFLRMKYIPELKLYLVVESKVEDFIGEAKRTFHINVALSIAISLFILFIVVYIIRKHQKQLENLANHDPLTKLLNRRCFSQQLQSSFDQNKASSSSFSLLFIDLDDFKLINDQHGHNVGDQVLIRVSQLLSLHVRQSDIVGRWGGEEFVVLFENTSLSEAQNMAEHLCRAIQQDYELTSLIKTPLTGSFGLTEILPQDSDVLSIISRADKAMYQAKNSGKNHVFVAVE